MEDKVEVVLRSDLGKILRTITYINEYEYVSRRYTKYKNGGLDSEYWYRNNKPMCEYRSLEDFRKESLSHRLEGPAIVYYSSEGIIYDEEFFIDGEIIKDPLEFYCRVGEIIGG